MAIKFYDKALTEKIKKWTQNTQVAVTSPEETRRLLEVIADNSDDNPIKLPLICVRRGLGFEILSTNKKPLTFDAATLEANEQKSLQLNAISVSIPYQIDIYTRYFEECDEYVRNFIFNIINFPRLDITLPYLNKNIQHTSNIRISNRVEDTSAIPERLIAGQFTRYSLILYVDDAYLFDVRVRDNYSIETQVEVVDLESIKKQ